MTTRAMVTPPDSPLRCPVDGKRMVVEIGQDDSGQTWLWHACLCCGHEERDDEWRPLVVEPGSCRALLAEATPELIATLPELYRRRVEMRMG